MFFACRINDQILFVNNANMNRASHKEAVGALKDAGMTAQMVCCLFNSLLPLNHSCQMIMKFEYNS